MTSRQLFELLRQLDADDPDHESWDREVVVRLSVVEGDDEDLHVGGLRSATVDAGCTDHHALTLDADQDSENSGLDDYP